MWRLPISIATLLGACVLAACSTSAMQPVSDPSPFIRDYLGDWVPDLLENKDTWPVHFKVAPDGSGTHTSVQAAIDDVPAASEGARRVFILIQPGTYREIVCAQNKVPFTLYARAPSHQVVLVEGRYNALKKPVGQMANLCAPNTHSATYGTFSSATVTIHSPAVHLVGFTIQNDAMDQVRNGQGYPEGVGVTGGPQAVALAVQGDRIQLAQMRLIGHQDTFFADKTSAHLGRVHVKDSTIAGDMDFIFGAAKLVVEHCLIISRAGRSPVGQVQHVLAPSTPATELLGFLVTHSRLLADPGVADGMVTIARPWDHAVKAGEWVPGISPNGQLIITQSHLGPHLGLWGRSTSGRVPGSTKSDAFRFEAIHNFRTSEVAPTLK